MENIIGTPKELINPIRTDFSGGLLEDVLHKITETEKEITHRCAICLGCTRTQLYITPGSRYLAFGRSSDHKPCLVVDNGKIGEQKFRYNDGPITTETQSG